MSDNNEKYDLYTEKIKQTPYMKYRGLIRIAKYALLTVFLSVLAGFFCGLAFRVVAKDTQNVEEKRNPVFIPQDVFPTRAVMDSQKPVDSDPTQEAATEILVEDGIVRQYQELRILTDKINKSIVGVKATSNQDGDYLASIWQEDYASGMIIANNGIEYLILTVYDLCRDADKIMVTFSGKYDVGASLLMGNTVTNTAILTVDFEDIPVEAVSDIRQITFGNSYLMEQGEPVIAVGTLYGLSNSVEYGMTVNTSNIIYDTDGRFGMLYTNIGSSGENSGFLFNMTGEAIGVITNNYGVNGNVAAYGISDLKKIVENMSNQKQISYLGIVGYDISETVAAVNRIPVGAYVSRTQTGSPAFYAGIQSGDIITRINDRTILNVYNISTALAELEPDTKVTVLVYRKGKEDYVPIEFTVTLSVQ